MNDVSPMTCFIVDRLMAFDREDRFSSYPELMDAVAQAQEEYARAMQESGLTWAERRAVEARRARRRKCRIIVASSIASVVALALGVWGWTKWREEELLLPQLRLRPFLLRRKQPWKTGGGGIAAGAQHPLRQTV